MRAVGSYNLSTLLGEGGMGAVYRANHTLLGRPAAIKLLLPELSKNQEIVNRFFNEARAATAIRHPGIVEIYDFGYVDDGSAYIAMELLDGESLGARLAARKVLPVADAVWIVRQMAGALGAAHARGIVHRDLKPDNVFLVRDPEVMTGERIKLLDFGIAKLASEPGQAQKTRTGALMGTPTYMAPEQCRGVAVDLRADLYSLGCILFEMVCGRVPFDGEGVGDILAAHIHVPVPSPRQFAPSLPPEVEALILHMLAKDPAQRPMSAEHVVAAIDNLMPVVGRPGSMPTHPTIAVQGPPSRPPTGGPGSVPPTTLGGAAAMYNTPLPTVPPRSKRGLWIALGGVLVGGVAIAIIAAASSSGGSDKKPDEPAPAAAPVAQAPVTPPPAPTPTPPAPTPPPAPAPVKITLDTTPSGATVMKDGNVLGKTPFHWFHPVEQGNLHLVVKLDGFQELPMDVPADANVDRVVALVKVESKVETKKVVHTTKQTKTKTDEDRNAGVNPFD